MRALKPWVVSATAAFAMPMVIAVGLFGRGARAQTIPTDPQGGCPVTAATFATWFESGVPALNGVVKPADSVALPAGSHCDFYSWSRQMFLWVTSPAPARYGGRSRGL